jgi:hypothetical protein
MNSIYDYNVYIVRSLVRLVMMVMAVVKMVMVVMLVMLVMIVMVVIVVRMLGLEHGPYRAGRRDVTTGTGAGSQGGGERWGEW